ncbi:MAG: YybH family protein [Caulobacteraceae bacterium]
MDTLRKALLVSLSGASLLILPQLATAAGPPAPSAAGRSVVRPKSDDEAQLRALQRRYLAAFNAKNADAIMANYAPGEGLFVFDAVPPRQYVGAEAYKKDWQALFAAYPGPAHTTVSDLEITVVGPVAYGHSINASRFTAKDGSKVDLTVRITDVYRKLGGRWRIVQEHVSFPVDLATGKADLLSKP